MALLWQYSQGAADCSRRSARRAPQSSAFSSEAERAEFPVLTVAGAPRSPEYNVSGPLLFVSNTSYTGVTVYHAKPKDPGPIANILDNVNSPAGDCLDSKGTLYVTNEPINGNGWVSEYPLGKTTASGVITNGVLTPAACAIDSRGNLWVTNIGGPNVTEYLFGSENREQAASDKPVALAISLSEKASSFGTISRLNHASSHCPGCSRAHSRLRRWPSLIASPRARFEPKLRRGSCPAARIYDMIANSRTPHLDYPCRFDRSLAGKDARSE